METHLTNCSLHYTHVVFEMFRSALLIKRLNSVRLLLCIPPLTPLCCLGCLLKTHYPRWDEGLNCAAPSSPQCPGACYFLEKAYVVVWVCWRSSRTFGPFSLVSSKTPWVPRPDPWVRSVMAKEGVTQTTFCYYVSCPPAFAAKPVAFGAERTGGDLREDHDSLVVPLLCRNHPPLW